MKQEWIDIYKACFEDDYVMSFDSWIHNLFVNEFIQMEANNDRD